jgi:DNA polymerase beta
MDKKPLLLQELELIRKKETQDRQVFKARAYAKVISQLQTLVHPVVSWDDLKDVSGIGDGIRKKIQEIFDTGVLATAEDIRKEDTFDVKEQFLQIYGVGPVKAKSLMVDKKLKTIADLRAAVKKDPKLLNKNQTIGLKYYEDLLQRIPRSEMEKHDAIVKQAAKHIFEKEKIAYTLEVVGSYRRGAENSGDIDVLLCFPTLSDEDLAAKWFGKLCDEMVRMEYIEEILAIGPKKCMGISRVSGDTKARRLDVLVTPKEQYAYALLYFTGSQKFNIAMRKHALERGYTMNEHGMVPLEGSNKPLPPIMKEERDIFTFLEYPYVPPSERESKKNV